MAPAAPSPFSLPPPRESRAAGGSPACPAGTADLPSAVPEPGALPAPAEAYETLRRELPRAALIQSLRAKIERLERPTLAAPRRDGHERTMPRAVGAAPGIAAENRAAQLSAWRLGCAEVDRLLPSGLDVTGLHEVKACACSERGASAADWMTGLGFGLRLAARRLHQVRAEGRTPLILWCWPRVLAGELGRPSWQGLAALGLAPENIIMVETAREAEALLALEEGLRSPALALAFGVLSAAALNPARRLSLAAAEGLTPCLIATHPAREAAAATATRWRIARAPSAPHPFDPRAPGLKRFSIALERCRAAPESTGRAPLLVEWCDETFRFGLASLMADHAALARRAGRGA